jgi:medium-chain acyl-[acyl-carrier-protein] hydrolase
MPDADLDSAARWLPYGPGTASSDRLRVFCFPFAGGGGSFYLPWRKDLPGIEICPVQPPGREGRSDEPMPAAFETLADDAARAIAPFAAGRHVFFAQSMAALLALDVARRLGADRRPSMLIVSGKAAPSLPADPPLSGLSDEALLSVAATRWNDPAAKALDRELADFFLPTLRADLRLLESRTAPQPASPLDCPLLVLGGASDAAVPIEKLVPWRRQTSGAFRLRLFTGGHFYLREDRVRVLAALREELSNGHT